MPIKSQVDRNWPSMYCLPYHEFIRQLKNFQKAVYELQFPYQETIKVTWYIS